MSSREFEEWVGYYRIQWDERREEEEREKEKQMFADLNARNKAALSKMGYHR